MISIVLELLFAFAAGAWSLILGFGLVYGHTDPTPVAVIMCAGSAFVSGLAMAFALDLISHEVR